MNTASIRDLRNRGGEIVDRAERGEVFTITRDGRPVAQLRPLAGRPPSGRELFKRAHKLPVIDPVKMRRDIEAVIDPYL